MKLKVRVQWEERMTLFREIENGVKLREGKEVGDNFICNICRGPSPLRGLKR